jgi:hypothetical protein
MKKILSLLCMTLILSSSVIAQQKTKPAQSSNSPAKEKHQGSTDFQSIWRNNLVLGKAILNIEKPSFNKEPLRESINGELAIKDLKELTIQSEKLYSLFPLEIIEQEKQEIFKKSLERIRNVSSLSELNAISIEIQQCINQSYFSGSWDYKAWMNGFNTK